MMLDIRIDTLSSSLIHSKVIENINSYKQEKLVKDLFIKQYGFLLNELKNTYPLPDLSQEKIEIKNKYELNDFLKYYDEDFIHNCFLGLLHREADTNGFENYLNKLRNGKLDRIEVLGRISLSKEARIKKIKVVGLKLKFFAKLIYKIPILGYFINLILIIIRLPRIIRHQEHIENQIMRNLISIKYSAHQKSNINNNAINKLIADINLNNDILISSLGKLVQNNGLQNGSLSDQSQGLDK